ncbi:MAG TPA: ABC transporter substrate-binding protein [Parachlamydiaceae bacterium]|nr:ABC transporter substrate-binding protein [Parachlamydiaceae bacterium]
MYKILLLLLLNISVLQANEDHSLIVGTNAEFPPFSYIENKTLVGFDIDIAKEVAKRLGKTIHFKDMPFDALIPDVALGHVDFVASGMSYTEERAKRVLFTRPYISEDPLVVLSACTKKLGLDDLKDKSVIVIEGFTADHFMSSKGLNNLTRLPTQADGFMAIKCGRADAFVTAKSTIDAFFEVQDASKFHVTILDGTGEKYAIMVPKMKAKMLIDIQNALDDMEKDGTMDQLKAKWKLQ